MSGVIKAVSAGGEPPFGGDTDPYELEVWKTQIEVWKTETNWRLEHSKISFNATINFAANVSKGLLLINGGANIALLTFFGNLWKTTDLNTELLAHAFNPAFGFYLAGVVAAMFTAMLSYMSQAIFSETETKDGKPPRHGLLVRRAGWLAGLASLACFVVGSSLAFSAFGHGLK